LIIKLIIIAGIIVVGGLVLFPQNLNLFYNDFDDKKDVTVNKAEETVEHTVDKITNTIDDTMSTIGNKLNDLNSKEIISAHGLLKKETIYYGQVFEKNENEKTCQVSVPEMAQMVAGKKELTHILSLDDCEFNVNDSIRIIRQGSGGSSSSGFSNFINSNFQSDSPPTETAPPIVDLTPSNLIFDTLSLSTIRYQDDLNNLNASPDPGDVQILYVDTSGKTISVTVTLRNSEKQLFSGVFHASKFETSVNDISDTPHIVEMIVEHEEHGTITSSVFNPAGSFDNKISGIFVKPN
jgi:hypothetical protein